MSVITGIIYNNEIIISADTLLSNLSDSNLNKDGFLKIYEFTLDNKKYLIGAAGIGEDLYTFLSALRHYGFSKPNYTSEDFVDEIQLLMKKNEIKQLVLLIGSFDDTHPKIYRVTVRDKDSIQGEGEYLFLLPDSVQENLDVFKLKIEDILKQTLETPLTFLRKVQLEVAEIDEYRYVNNDFYYKILNEDFKIEKPTMSDKGIKI